MDDASTDATAALATTAGARVIRLPHPGGPYEARNAGWRAAEADVVVFTDVRNRAEPGWLASLSPRWPTPRSPSAVVPW